MLVYTGQTIGGDWSLGVLLGSIAEEELLMSPYIPSSQMKFLRTVILKYSRKLIQLTIILNWMKFLLTLRRQRDNLLTILKVYHNTFL